jgi:hypothetical protein
MKHLPDMLRPWGCTPPAAERKGRAGKKGREGEEKEKEEKKNQEYH